jgi:hypothetical protein
MDLYIFHREPVGLLGVFFGLSFFRCNQVSVEFWIYFGTYIFQSLVVLELTQTGYLGILGVTLDLYFFTWYFGFILGFCLFLYKPVGVIRFFGLVIFLGIWYRGLVFYSEFGCLPLDIYWYLLYLFPLYFTHLFIPYLLISCPCILHFTCYCLECHLNTGPLNPESVTLTTEPWSCEWMLQELL